MEQMDILASSYEWSFGRPKVGPCKWLSLGRMDMLKAALNGHLDVLKVGPRKWLSMERTNMLRSGPKWSFGRPKVGQ